MALIFFSNSFSVHSFQMNIDRMATNDRVPGEISTITTPYQPIPFTQQLSFQLKEINSINSFYIKIQGTYGITTDAIFAIGNIISGTNASLEEENLLQNRWHEFVICLPGLNNILILQ